MVGIPRSPVVEDSKFLASELELSTGTGLSFYPIYRGFSLFLIFSPYFFPIFEWLRPILVVWKRQPCHRHIWY